MAVYLNTETRLNATVPAELVNLASEPATHPLHRLYDDDQLEAKLDRIFKRAFGQNLILNRGAGRDVMLHLGDRHTLPNNPDRQSREFRRAVNALPMVHEQGDGMRAFVGVLLGVLAMDRDAAFIDEPEAFLHPPQANMIGRVLAEQTPSKRQLFVATHSTDFLKGVLDHSSPRVRVVRLQRTGDVNFVTELRPEAVRSVWGDPILRYSRVLEGLFHDGAIVCEGDADCRFYGAMLDAVFGNESRPDLALVHGAGKSQIATIVKALRAMGVPVRVVTDFDTLSDLTTLKSIVEALGGDWVAYKAGCNIIKSAIDQRRAEVPTADARQNIIAILDREKSNTISEKTTREIREVLKRGSAWSEAKRLGKAFVPSGEQLASFAQLAGNLRGLGLHLVEVGELEGFCRTISGHGPEWVAEVLK